MYKAQSVYTKLALRTLVDYLTIGKTGHLEQENHHADLLAEAACFVSVHKTNGELRGCIGTLEPRYDNLFREIIRNAVSAAVHDSRFAPMVAHELESIEVSVDVLSTPELVTTTAQLDPQKYGVIISDGVFRKGVLLPRLEGIDTTEQQLDIAKSKAGIYEIDTSKLEIYRFTSERFH